MRAGLKPCVWTILLFATTLAGCFAAEDAPNALTDAAAAPAAADSQVVIAVIDSGINAYHAAFRDESPLAHAHPSTYIPGYPEDAVPLHLSFDAADWESAVTADCARWNALEPHTFYYVPGTRIVGIVLDELWAERRVDCDAGEIPAKGLDARIPHGTGAAGRAAGTTTSLCPECRIVAAQMPQTTDSMKWVAEQPWIDVQTNSWAAYACHQVPAQGVCTRGAHELAREATSLQVTFAASGNGIRHRDGVTAVDVGVGIPTYLRPAQGHEGVLVVGGHDNGEVLLWPGTLPHVVADSWAHPSAPPQGFDEEGTFGGTSGATPFAAGTFARMLLEARRMVGDTGTGLRDGNLVIAADDAAFPPGGPLADGVLSREEAERVFLLTAVPRPVEEQPFDGGFGCRAPGCVRTYTNTFVPWAMIPPQVPAYSFIGYGQVGVASLAAALAVLAGEAEAPARDMEDHFFAADAMIRRTLQE